MITRRGGGVPLGAGRVGVPLTGIPNERWITVFREAAAAERTGDDRWQHAALNATSDVVNGVPYLLLLTGIAVEDAEDRDPVLAAISETDADFFVTYVGPIDAGIAVANRQA